MVILQPKRDFQFIHNFLQNFIFPARNKAYSLLSFSEKFLFFFKMKKMTFLN